MTQSTSENSVPIDQPNTEKLFHQIYNEKDLSKLLGIAIAGSVGFLVFYLSHSFRYALFSAMIAFPAVRLFASPIHSFTKSRLNLRREKKSIKQTYTSLSEEEKKAVELFVDNGAGVITWSQVNRSEVSGSAIESLSQRGLLHVSITLDGMTETFVLDVTLFSYACSLRRN